MHRCAPLSYMWSQYRNASGAFAHWKPHPSWLLNFRLAMLLSPEDLVNPQLDDWFLQRYSVPVLNLVGVDITAPCSVEQLDSLIMI